MWLEVLETSGSGCRCAENLWRCKRNLWNPRPGSVFSSGSTGKLHKFIKTSVEHRPISIPTEVLHVIWYYWKVQGADSVRTDQMNTSRSVIERREVSPSAKRTPSQNKHSRWFLMGWHRHFFPHFYRQLRPQSHKPGGHGGVTTNFPDLIQFSPKRQKNAPHPCYWNDASYILYMLTMVDLELYESGGLKQSKHVSCHVTLS